MDTKILWLAKRLKDVCVEIDKLSVEDKIQVIEGLYAMDEQFTTDIYSTLNCFMHYLGEHNRKINEENAD
ncbi:hypothetical protein HZI73_22280 [Vallitalea pronyensis]|uniref:Uncharacterized protein n=1 Tax=Vallitalea pronyensis TaxID=1348613 RepID=A0A8J8MN63_9FIRM|nr:hypothetical protein [Vallitalea pronyensis]QUI24860.1 hypothetical protein HZI73_22280 [Vallitalea pronyensis]